MKNFKFSEEQLMILIPCIMVIMFLFLFMQIVSCERFRIEAYSKQGLNVGKPMSFGPSYKEGEPIEKCEKGDKE